MSGRDADDCRKVIQETHALTSNPFAANFILDYPHEELLKICLEEGVPAISMFWGNPAPLVKRIHSFGAKALMQVGSVEEAKASADAGVDIIVAQGFEAGGHVRGEIASMVLIPAVIDAVAPVPVVAAGGICDGRGLAAALALGAAGAWIGTRFLFSDEAALHQDYVDCLVAATVADTVHTKLFDSGWPDAPHRVIRNSTVTKWEKSGRPPPGERPGEGDVLAKDSAGHEIVRYEPYTVGADFEGEIEALSLWAGQCVGLTNKRQPAAHIVGEIFEQAGAILRKIAGTR
jgi:NAD(P)H-dependent flavin oxidoreductase YrpB (nitropropane dioxygenase family)